MQSDTEVRAQIGEAIDRFNNLVSTKNPKVLAGADLANSRLRPARYLRWAGRATHLEAVRAMGGKK